MSYYLHESAHLHRGCDISDEFFVYYKYIKKNVCCNNWCGTGDIYHVFSSARTKIKCGSNFVQFDVQQRIIIANLSSVIVFLGMKKIRK